MTESPRGQGGGDGSGSASSLIPYLFVTVAMFCFASNVIIGRWVHLDVPPVGLSFWRWTAATLLFLPFGVGPIRRQWQLITANWKRLLVLAAAMAVFGNTLVYVGLQYTSALNGGIMPVSRPVVILTLMWMFFGAAITRGQVAGTAIAMVGVLTIVLRGDLSALAELRFSYGDMVLFAANVGLSVYQVLLPRTPKELHPNALLLVLMALGAMMLVPFYIAETIYVRPVEFTPVVVGAVLAVAIFPSIIAVGLINRGLVVLGSGRVGILNYLSPVFIAIMAIGLLGETPHLYHGIAISLVIGGILIANRGGAKGSAD